MLAELSLEPGHQRGHGALYDALNCGKVQVSRLRWALAGVPLPAWDDGRIRLAVDVSNWLRPDYILLYQASNGTWSGVGYAYWAESFPTRIRAPSSAGSGPCSRPA